VTEFIDPEELPFTTDELFRAGCCFLPREVAQEMAENLASCGADLIEARVQRRAGWRAAGIPNADTMKLGAWGYPDELLPALASLSSDVEARARFLVEDQWESLRQGLLNGEQWAAAERAGLVPSREDLLRQIKSTAVSPEDEASPLGLAISLPELPPLTPEMEAAVESQVAERCLAWDATVIRFRNARGRE
jgi:hypothetical protein